MFEIYKNGYKIKSTASSTTTHSVVTLICRRIEYPTILPVPWRLLLLKCLIIIIWKSVEHTMSAQDWIWGAGSHQMGRMVGGLRRAWESQMSRGMLFQIFGAR